MTVWHWGESMTMTASGKSGPVQGGGKKNSLVKMLAWITPNSGPHQRKSGCSAEPARQRGAAVGERSRVLRGTGRANTAPLGGAKPWGNKPGNKVGKAIVQGWGSRKQNTKNKNNDGKMMRKAKGQKNAKAYVRGIPSKNGRKGGNPTNHNESRHGAGRRLPWCRYTADAESLVQRVHTIAAHIGKNKRQSSPSSKAGGKSGLGRRGARKSTYTEPVAETRLERKTKPGDRG